MSRFGSVHLTDGVIACRAPAERDLDGIVAACQDPDIPRFTRVPSPYTPDHGRTFLATAAAGWENGTDFVFAVVDPSTDAFLGACGVHHRADRDGAGEIGYWIDPGVRGRGAATRAVVLVARWGIAVVGYPRIELIADVDNHASIRVAERAGFHREGVMRSRVILAGARRDAVLFSLIAADLGSGR